MVIPYHLIKYLVSDISISKDVNMGSRTELALHKGDLLLIVSVTVKIIRGVYQV